MTTRTAHAPATGTGHPLPARALPDAQASEGPLAFAPAHDAENKTADARPGVSPEVKRLIRQQAEYHRDTIIELAKR